ncbi:MBL fold metallo-hydrolase [Nocardioides convexus]|uniref:MBL fold metallo-hydrolase n=1 Tax=Nocardioides convexus TaxID=2712224 RepID=UPI00241823E2|nr:MBL fold metallo-hydrolase [Nocardioides convexus]
MRLTKFGHAAVRIEHDGTTLVLDPGMWSERESVDSADAVLITHEHADHYDAENLRATDAPIYTIAAVAAQIRESAPDVAERVTVVAPDETWTIGGIGVRAIGEPARRDPPGPAALPQQRLPDERRRAGRLPPRRRADRARRAGRRAAHPGLRAVDAAQRGHRLRALGRRRPQRRDPRPGLLRGRAGDRRRPVRPPARRARPRLRPAGRRFRPVARPAVRPGAPSGISQVDPA